MKHLKTIGCVLAASLIFSPLASADQCITKKFRKDAVNLGNSYVKFSTYSCNNATNKAEIAFNREVLAKSVAHQLYRGMKHNWFSLTYYRYTVAVIRAHSDMAQNAYILLTPIK